MSIWYDSKLRKPQVWTYISFIFLTALFLWTTYDYGDMKAKQQEARGVPVVREFK